MSSCPKSTRAASWNESGAVAAGRARRPRPPRRPSTRRRKSLERPLGLVLGRLLVLVVLERLDLRGPERPPLGQLDDPEALAALDQDVHPPVVEGVHELDHAVRVPTCRSPSSSSRIRPNSRPVGEALADQLPVARPRRCAAGHARSGAARARAGRGRSRARAGSTKRRLQSSRGRVRRRDRRQLLPARRPGPRPVRAGQAGRGGAARARARARASSSPRTRGRSGRSRPRSRRSRAASRTSTAIRTAAPGGCAPRSPSGTASRFEEVAVGAGADGLIDCLSQASLDPGDEIVCGWPSFASYVIDARKLGAVPVKVPLRDAPLRPRRDARGDHAADEARLRLPPEQPDRDDEHARRARRVPRRACPSHVLVVIDQAYCEYVDDPDYPDAIEEYFKAGRPVACCGRSRRSTGSPGCASATWSRRRRWSRPRTR